MESAEIYRLNAQRTTTSPAAPPANSSGVPQKPKLLDQVRQAIRTRHYSHMTEKAYVGWIKRFIFFHNKRHPAEMGELEIANFLSSLATESKVSASTQNQALHAILFLYQEVLQRKIGFIDGVVRAQRPKRLPVVLTREEVRKTRRHERHSLANGNVALRCRSPAHGMLPFAGERCRLLSEPNRNTRWQRRQRPPHDASRHG
jgi:integrase